jgi:hypothetical protein
MTEPATLDVAMKALAGAKPAAPPKSADKAATKPPDAAPTAATPSALGSRTLLGWLARSVTKKQLTVGAAAVCSLAAGIAAVRLMSPGETANQPSATATQPLIGEPRQPVAAPARPPALSVEPGRADFIPPTGIVIPKPPEGLVPGVAPTTPPTYPPPTYPPPTYPAPSMPLESPGGGLPAIPVPPPAGSPSSPVPPRDPRMPPPPDSLVPPASPVIPASGTVLPPIPGLPTAPPGTGSPVTPPTTPPSSPPSVPPVIPPTPPGGATLPALPPLPADLSPKPPGSVPGSPVAPPGPTAPGGMPPVAPMDLGPVPPVGPGGGTGAKIDFVKPAHAPTVTPVVNTERTPTTSYDVDIYEPKAGDTYEAISREFYNDAKYAAALRAYNRNKPLTGGTVDVPPIHVLRRMTVPQPGAGTGTPVGRSGTAADPPWAGVAPSAPATGGAGKTFRVPEGGMSLPAVSRLVLGTEQRWDEIYRLNPDVNAAKVPAGTDLKLPPDARVP